MLMAIPESGKLIGEKMIHLLKDTNSTFFFKLKHTRENISNEMVDQHCFKIPFH